MVFKKVLKQAKQGLVVSISFVLLAIAHRRLRPDLDEQTHRWLYESDDNDGCLEDEYCRFALGLCLLVITPLIIFWNEHQHVKLENLYNTARRHVHDIQSPKIAPPTTMNGKLVCFSGRLQGETTLCDDLFPCIKVDSALLLAREIEIYQFVQKRQGEDGYTLKQEWCRLPQPDPSKFPDKKNFSGNWELFADNDRMVNTGHKLKGKPIQFGDNVVVFRAPSPSVGAFAIPRELMNEAFLGERHVHRLAELEMIKSSQGEWCEVKFCFSLNPQSLELVSEGICDCHNDGEFIYDGDKDRIGTIRFKWRFVTPQDLTIAAEAVMPGRPCTAGYGSSGRNVKETGAMRKMIMQDLSFGFQEKSPLLLPQQKQVNENQWSLTPFSVRSVQLFPPYREKFLGRLWLYAPGRHTSKELFKMAHRASARCLWKVRGVSYIALFVGWCLVFEPLSNIFRVSLLRSLLSLAFTSFAFVLAATCCLSCTAVARFTTRPMQSVLLIGTVWVVVVELSGKIDEWSS